jgi:hypothetical protein
MNALYSVQHMKCILSGPLAAFSIDRTLEAHHPSATASKDCVPLGLRLTLKSPRRKQQVGTYIYLGI